jgi:hypothetical protein
MHEAAKDAPDESAVKGSVPAGGAGADSGAVEAVEVERGDHAPIQNVSTMNDTPGVGTRGADDEMERGDGDRH